MKALKIIGVIILVIVLIGVLATVFGPSEVHMKREITINAPVQVVYDEIKGFKTFDEFSAWSEIDTTAKIVVEGPISGVGASYSWQSDNPDLGIGAMQIVEADENKMVKYKMNFEGFPGEPTASWILVEEGDLTKVTYTYDQTDISGIWKLFAYGTEGMVGPMYDRTLEKLKKRVENRPELKALVTVLEVDSFTFLGTEITTTQSSDEIAETMGTTYGELMTAIVANDLEMSEGYPLAIVTSYDDTTIGMVCGIPVVQGSTIDANGFSIMQSPEGPALRALHFGSYDLLKSTHEEISVYADYYGYKISGYPWEIYVTDPGVESDTTKWLTEVYYPVQ